MRIATLPSRMRGVSMTGWLVILIVVTVFGSAGVKTVPAYLEYNTIKGLINGVLQDPRVGMKSENEIQNDISRRFDINNITAIRGSDVLVVKAGNRVTLSVDYEVRKNLFGNLDLVMTFGDDFSKDGRQ